MFLAPELGCPFLNTRFELFISGSQPCVRLFQFRGPEPDPLFKFRVGIGKLLFQWVYWHALLPGREIPGIGPAMPTAGKARAAAHT